MTSSPHRQTILLIVFSLTTFLFLFTVRALVPLATDSDLGQLLFLLLAIYPLAALANGVLAAAYSIRYVWAASAILFVFLVVLLLGMNSTALVYVLPYGAIHGAGFAVMRFVMKSKSTHPA